MTVAGFEFELRPVPSAGALHPLEIHLIASSVSGLEPGTYRYVPESHSVERTGATIPPDLLCALFLGQPYLAGASAVAVVAATFGPSFDRYGDRGYRYLLFEAGHVAQNLNLTSSALGLGNVNLGGFVDQSVAEALRLTEYVPLYGVALGRPTTPTGREVR